jgi:hypothetical protein
VPDQISVIINTLINDFPSDVAVPFDGIVDTDNQLNNILGNFAQSKFFLAENSITVTSQSSLVTAQNSERIMEAGNFVSIQSSFTASYGSEFTARIGNEINCDVLAQANYFFGKTSVNAIPTQLDLAEYNGFTPTMYRNNTNYIFVSDSADASPFSILSFTLHPNPATQQVTLGYAAQIATPTHITFTDVHGRTVLQQNLTFSHTASSHTVAIGHLPAGVYNLVLTPTGGTPQHQRLVVSH